MNIYSIHLSNTPSGEYNPKLPLPKPFHCDAKTGRIVRGYPDVAQVIGFAADPDEQEVDWTWFELAGMDSSSDFADTAYGTFLVVCDHAGAFATLTLPVSKMTMNGVEL